MPITKKSIGQKTLRKGQQILKATLKKVIFQQFLKSDRIMHSADTVRQCMRSSWQLGPAWENTCTLAEPRRWAVHQWDMWTMNGSVQNVICWCWLTLRLLSDTPASLRPCSGWCGLDGRVWTWLVTASLLAIGLELDYRLGMTWSKQPRPNISRAGAL